jgi:hypothetical protein
MLSRKIGHGKEGSGCWVGPGGTCWVQGSQHVQGGGWDRRSGDEHP